MPGIDTTIIIGVIHNILEKRARRPCFIVETTSMILGHVGFLFKLN
jgi:hypothetical protein